MTVKEQVKEIIHDIKHHFSHHKHHRDESSTSSHTLVSDDSSHTAHSGGHSRPGTPERGELSSHLGTPEHGDFVPTTPERKRVLSVSSHKHNVFLKLRRRKSSNLSIDPRSKTPEREVFPNGSQPGTPEHSVTSSNPGTPESSSFNHGSARQRVPSTPTRKPNVLHKFRRGSSHFKSSSEPHAPEKGEIPVIHHHSSMSKLREHLGSHAPETTELPAIHHHSSLSKLRDGQDVFQSDAEADREVAETATAKDGESTHGPLPIIITSPPMEEKTESYGGTLHPSMYEGGVDIIDRPSVQLECEPVPEAEEEVASEDTGSFVEVDRVQTQTNLDTEQNQTDLDMEPTETNVNVGQTQADSDTVQTQTDLDVGQTQADLDVEQTRTDLDVEQTWADSDIEQGLTDLDGEQTRTDLNVGQTQADSDTVQTQTDLKVEETQADSDIEQSQTDLVVEQTRSDLNVEQGQVDLDVEQGQADLDVGQMRTDLDVEQGQADLDVEQTRTELDVEQAQTDLAVEQIQTELGVEQGQADLNIGQDQAEAETQTSAEPASEGPVVAPISQKVCDSSSASDPVAIIDSALNPDGNDRKSVEVPRADPVTVDPPVLAVIDSDQDIATEEVKEPIGSEMFTTKDDHEAEVQAQSTVDTSLSEETTLAQSVPSLPEPVNPHVSPTHPTPSASASIPSSSPYLPRLTAPTMFLPIPNVRVVFPFWSLLGWLAPWRVFSFFRSLFSRSSSEDASHSLSSASLELASSHYHPQFYLTFPSPFLSASPLFTGSPKSHDSRSSLPR